jgi:hypothetical protein
LTIKNPCEHAKLMLEKNALQTASMSNKGWMKLANIKTDAVVYDTNIVEFCPICGIKFEFS